MEHACADYRGQICSVSFFGNEYYRTSCCRQRSHEVNDAAQLAESPQLFEHVRSFASSLPDRDIQTHQHRKVPFHQVHTALNVAQHCHSVGEIVDADFGVRVLARGRNCGGLLPRLGA